MSTVLERMASFRRGEGNVVPDPVTVEDWYVCPHCAYHCLQVIPYSTAISAR